MSLEQAGQEQVVRNVTDAQTMRALAHPVRIALVEGLVLGGAMTATQLGELIGESPTTCSFHLRQLAKYGFVEEAGGGKGRARPWRLTSIGFSIGGHENTESELAADALLSVIRERQLGRLDDWLRTKASYPKEWRDAADSSEYLFYLTADELKQLGKDMHAILMPRFRERIANPEQRPTGALPVEMLIYSYPIRYPDAGSDDSASQK
jgi:predicted ArsR family transcriptional regulator